MLKNLKEKLKKGITKKKIATIAIFAVAVIIAIIAIVVNQTNEQSSKRKKIIADGELARAMTYDQFVDGDEAVEGTDNVKFSAFFLRDINGDGYAEKIKGTCKQIGKEDTLYMEVNVQTDGILKNAKIEVDGKNFYLATTAPKDNELKDNYVGTNIKKLEFNDMANGTQKLITGVVRSGDYSYSSSKASAIGSNINNLSRNDNKIIFTGTYVGSDGNEVQINKEINLQTDWYGTTSAGISTSNYSSSSTYYDIQDRQNEEDGTLTLTAGIRAFENNYQLNIKKNYVEGTIPQLNGYDPISVTAETSTDSFNYDETTRKFTLTREAQVDETGNITKSISRDNIHTLKIVYPLEAYKSLDSTVVTIEIPVMTYYEGYNNTNREFTNPYKSNEAKGILTYTFRGPQEYQTNMNIRVGEYMYNPTYRYVVSKKKPIRIYNEISSEEKDDNYIVSWYISKGTNESSDGLIMKERKDGEATVTDNFVKVDATRDSMESLTTNIGIGFGNADKFLGDDGYIKVYDDETDELLVTFTKDDWGKYTRTSPYKFSMPVKHIRVETSQTQDSQYFYVYSQKQLDDEYITTNYTREQFDELKYIESHLNVYAGTKLLGTLSHMANYEAPYSIAELTLSKNTLSTQLTEKNEILTIKATANESANQVGWTNGSFLIKLPADIIATDINTVEINNSSISLTSYEYIENDNGKFIKINTKNTNNTAQTFEVRIDTNITPDPRIATTTENFELWASNEEGVDYYYNSADIYDVNDNLNLDEKVHKSTTSVSLIAPNSLLTNQTASGFDKSGTQIVSPQIADVKPQLATVSQDTPEKTVKIGAQIKNNYSSVITDVVMLGKIPFEGNTYVLSGEDLGSEFTTKMTNKGIEVPEALQGKVTVYYSENETPDKDLSNTDNGWKTAENITNWDNVKTYLIDFQDVEIASGAEYTFYYTIQVPNGLDYNKKTFSHHGVYFSLKTPEGKYKTQTEPNKLGIRIAEKYNLELQKYQTGKTNLVPGATYKVTKEATDTDEEEVATAVTNAEGILELQNLYAKRTYAIEEIKVPEDYELNTDVIKIIGTVQADASLQITKIQGTTREDIEVTKEEDEPYKVTVKVEDEAKVKLKLTKLEKDTTTPIRGVKYKLTGAGISERGKNVTTNTNGEITVKGLKVGEEYTLEETKAEGYYLASPIKFTVANTDGTYEINVSEGTVKESNITEEENIPTANIQVEDEKIPTYNLEISKIQRITSTAVTEDELRAKAEQALSSTDTVYLSGAKFRLYKGTKELGSYITDENGKITLNDLYQYIDGKDEEATYTLKETLSPEGYSKVKDITFKVDGSTGELKFINTEGKDESYTVEGSTVKLLVEDSPSFKLIKKDSETDELLANIKFAIYNIDNDTTTPAKNSKGEIIGIKETINGKEYYTVTTDSKGEITADLPEGMYKAVEVQAPDKYDISDSTYYFGIGTSREGKEGIKATWAEGIGGTNHDYIDSVAECSDGGYIVGGHFNSSSIDLENGVSLTNKGDSDGMVIKYSENGEIEWAEGIGGKKYDEITSVAECSDGGYIVGGHFSSSIDLGNGISLTYKGNGDGMIIKYNARGEVEWAERIGGEYDDKINSVSETRDGGYIVGGYFKSSSIDLGTGISLTNKGSYDGMIIKYNAAGEVEWAEGIGGTNNDYIDSVAECSDGGYIVGGNFESSSIDLGNGISLTNKGITNSSDGMIIKYNARGEVEWAEGIGGTSNDYIESVSETSDGGYIVGGYFKSSSIDLGTGISLTNKGSYDGMIIKYNVAGEVKWAEGIGGTSSDPINSVSETSDGGYIIGGYFYSQSIDLGNEVSLIKNGNSDGMIIKYSTSGEAEWAEGIGGTENDEINSVSETSDGGYIVGGDFRSSSIDLGTGISLTNKGSNDGMLIKLEKIERPTPTVIKAYGIGGTSSDPINSVSETRDGGYIVGGYFSSSSIDLGNGISLTNKGITNSSDGMIIKYNARGEVEWAEGIGGTSNDYIESVSETSDGGYIVGGYFSSSSIDLGNGISLTNKSSNYRDGMIIKYNARGEVEWAEGIGGAYDDEINSVAETSDGGYIVGGYFSNSSIDLGTGISLTNKGLFDGMIIKYNAAGEVEWAEGIGGSGNDQINTVASTSDGGYIVGGYFESSSIDLGNGISLTNKGYRDGMIIKYNAAGEVEWAEGIRGSDYDYIESVSETSDGGCIVGGYFKSSSIDLGNGISLTNKGYRDGMIIKYNAAGEVEWAEGIGGTSGDSINSVSETQDGGYIVGGYFESSSIDLGNGISLTNKGNDDGMIIKYNAAGEVEWAEGIGGSGTDQINIVASTSDGCYIVGGDFSSSSINLDNGKLLTNSGGYDGMILKVTAQMGVPEVQELEVENKRKEFKITTDVKEIDNTKGGSISGEDENPYEKVKYGDTSTNEIKMIPDENYEIIGITVNGEDYNYIANEDGSYTMPAFTNMTEDKHIVVTYSLKDNKITINKVDKNTKEKLSGATFKLDQIEERSEPDNSEIIGELTDNGQEYTQVIPGDEVTGKLGELTNNGTYYFVQNEDGTYTPTNSKTYQTANGGTAGISSSTANSYIPIDLTDLAGQYEIVVNASCSSETNFDIGYATITENATAPSYNSLTGNFMYVSGTSDTKDYKSAILEGGKVYYLHLGYRKDGGADSGTDQIVINSIKLYTANTTINVYNFTNNNGKYESTNQGEDNTVSNSYIPIDLTNYTGKYNLTVNTEVSSERGDYGYATVTENTTRPSYNNSTGRFVYISGTQSAKDYTTVLQGGKMYYLHLGYYKNTSDSSGDDKFTVNSVNITLNDSELYHTTVETNSDGQAITQIPFGKYSITETKAPDGYWLNETPTIVEFRSTDGAVHEFTIEDEAKAKLTVHHYIKGTTTKLAEDEKLEAHIRDSYTTNPKLDLDKYELETDETGKLILPENATGIYAQTPTEVTYYYVEKKIPLTVHHYIEGTTTQVPLKTGGTAGDQVDSGLGGENYTTSAISDENLSDEYELAEVPANANGIYAGDEVIVTYYYKKVSREINLVKYQQDGTTPLQGAKFTIRNKDINGIKIEKIQNNGTYYFENNDGKYVSNNKNKSNTTANSYIKIDMTNASEDTTVTINAEISSESGCDIGYATMTENTTAPSYSSAIGRFIYISGTQSAKDYTANLEKGKIYYLHFGYKKDGSVDTGTDTFTVNSIKINGVDYLNCTKGVQHTTDASGKIQTKLEAGTYEVTEIEAPEGYKLPENPTTEITITKETTTEDINITNDKKTGTVTVHHYIEGTTNQVPMSDGSLAENETKTGYVGDMYATTAKEGISDSYELVSEPENSSGNYIEGNIEVIYYYRPVATSVLVHHYLEGTTTKLADDETIDGRVGDEYTTSVANVDNKYELVATPANANGNMTKDQIIVIYYYRVKDTSVLVHHYKEGTTEKVSEDVTLNGKIDEEYTTTIAEDLPEYYELVAEPDNKNGTMTEEQIVVTYYYRLKKYPYTVNYLEKGTNKVLHEAKTTEDITYGTVINTKDEVIDINGYGYDSADKDSLSIAVSENVINIYYTKITGLSYTVNYLEKDTDEVLHTPKTADGQTFEDEITSADEVIDIDGYNYDSVDKDKLIIGTGENVINIYYTKRNDLAYTVNYLEKDTNKVLHEPKNQTEMTFKDTVTSADEVIDIDGYDYDSVDKATLIIGTDENVINIYYTKRTDLSYKVNYLEKDTNKILHDQKNQEGMTFESVVNSSNEVIDIDGYDYDSVDKETLTIGTSENVINIYYTKRNDLSYKVNYLEKDTNKVLHDQKVRDGMTFESTVTSSDEVIGIDGYNYDSVDKDTLTITTGENIINIYYTKRNDLSYKVNYLEKTTNKVLHDQKVKDGMTFESVVTSSDEVIEIDGYNYDSVDKDTLTITTGENVINIYYTKRTDLSYEVNYLEKGTNKVLHNQKIQNGMTFESKVETKDEVIDIEGYKYDSADKDTLIITTGANIINIYYTKITGLSYTVNYLEKDTNEVINPPKVQDGMTFEDVVTSANEVIDIDGYNYDSVDKDTLTIGTGENVINIYYTKRNDLSYKVNYLEKGTNKVLHDQKVQENMIFKATVTSSDEVIDIDGYNYDSVDKDTLTITTGENVINIYYTKRNDLSYTVNYLEKDTNIVLHEPKVTENMTFETVINSDKEVIDIDGYNYDSVDKDTLVIVTGENVINIYYTKRNDLSYTVNYLEKGTNRTIHAPKVTQNMTFGTEITSSKEVIAINGYSYDSVDKDNLIITTGENVINIYYTKVSGLSYTVNYLEKDTNEVLQAPKTKGDMTFEDEIISSNEVIDIDGYNYDSVDKDKLVIGTGENVINIYYTKRNDLSYKVNYLEKDTNKVLHDQKVQENMTFESVVTSANEVIDIDGYNYDSVDKETLIITTEENVINIYYTKRTDLSYTVNYLEKDTNKVLHEPKTQDGMTFESVVNSADEVIDIYGYNYDSVNKDTLTITTGENVINIYYTKKDTKVIVHYYEEGTTNKVSEDVERPGKVFDNYETESASDIPSKYELVAEPENKNGTMTEDEITVIYYYRKKATQVIVHYYEENTTKKLSEDVTINGRVDDKYTTVSADDIPIKYELVATPSNANGSMTEATIEVIYYYRVKDAVVHVRYLEKGTDIVLADPDRLDGKVDEDYQTTPKEIDGYQLVEHTGNEKGKFEVEPLTVTYYYLYKTKATVQYIDKTTGAILEQSTTEGLEGDDFVTESKDFENYVLVEEPPEKTVKMTKEEQILKYYYIHVSGGVIEKHIDVISGQILANAVHNGNEGDAYDIPSRTFDGYDLVEDRLPSNAKGTMKVEPVEVIYYYIYRSKVTAEYIDKNTGSKLTEDETQKGHEGDNYATERKTFDDYKLVEVPANADGSMTKEDITVTYYYVHTSGGVIVNHIDIKTGKQLLDETKEEGYEGDLYETHEENIPEYDLVKEKYPENATGKMTIEPTRVTYYYIKKTEVNVKYVDKETGEEIDEPTNIPGHEGDDYTTEPKDVPGYDLIEEPENKDGTMTADPIDVIYYYKRPAKVIVNYYDIDTKEKLADEIEITGHQNDDYITEQKDIKYYEIAKVPENKDGKMIVNVTKDENGKEIVDDTTYVNYYYRKLIFNLKVDKTIASVIVNGQETPINGNLGKVEVHRKNISTANVKVVYKIKVTNDSELTGKANVVENIPSGMTMIADNNPGWTINETTASIETDEIKPGESREYQVVLGWQNGDGNIGTKENIASIITENEAGFEEKDKSDNESKADLIVAVGTGEVPYVAIAGSILLIMISITAGIYMIKKKRQ